jgi:hypothetical protein
MVSWVEHFFALPAPERKLMGILARTLILDKFSDGRMIKDFRKVI